MQGLNPLSKEGVKKAKLSESEDPSLSHLGSWLRLQKSLANRTGAAVATVDPSGQVVGKIENDNSICEAMHASPDHAPMCALDCGRAHTWALNESRPVEFRCHAGLHCFAFPLPNRKFVILGGRAFNSSAEYSGFLRRYGDLVASTSGSCLRNVKFMDAHDLADASKLIASTTQYQPLQPRPTGNFSSGPLNAPRHLLDAHLEIIRLTDELENKRQSLAHLSEVLRGAASPGYSKRGYDYMLAKLGAAMNAESGSIMVLDEQSNELAVEAALGFELPRTRVKLGDPVAGAVLASGSPMVVRDVDTDSRVSRSEYPHYRTKSFISFPIVLEGRKVGVINLTGRIDGTAYTPEDVSLVEFIAPHLALMIDRAEWHKKAEEFQQMSLTDPLTGLPNRRYLEERLYEEVERSKRHGTALSFMIIDVDRFKTYNDLYGHTSADHVLVKAAHSLRRSVRAIDMSARFAGDEFCIILPETEEMAALRIAERLRAEVAGTEFKSESGESMGKITISIGVSSFGAGRQSPRSMIESADRALYQAKTRGRNCVVVYEEAVSERPNRSGPAPIRTPARLKPNE
jgi:diguanylate cyclase (GGDEF)-like protein